MSVTNPASTSGAIAATVASTVASTVVGAVRLASLRTGVDFSYLLTQARIESGLNPQAQAKTSSATGLYQFTGATWLETVRKHGAEHGLDWAANALKKGVSHLSAETRSAILALRKDAGASANMAAEFASDNKARLEKALGTTVGATELYLAHFLGAGGATHFLKARAADASASAASVNPSAAHANRAIFYAANGRARTLGEVFDRFAAKFAAAPPPDTGTAVPVTGKALPPITYAQVDIAPVDPSVTQQSARLAYLLLAGLSA